MIKDLSDHELIILINEGNKQAEETLYSRYKLKSEILGKVLYYQYKSTGIQDDEFIQVALICVSKAIRLYKDGKNFEKYWKKIVNNEVIDYIKTDRSIFTNSPIRLSLDECKYADDGKMQLHEVLCQPDEKENVESLSQLLEEFIYSKNNNFTDDEALAAHLMYYRSLSTMQIAEFTGWKKAKAFYVVKGVRSKISNYLKSGYFK